MKSSRRGLLCTISALAVFGLAAAGCSSGGGGTTATAPTTNPALKGSVINIGVIASLTGPQAPTCNQGGTVGPAWADWINANNGINGHPVNVIVQDDHNDPGTAQSVEKNLIDTQHVVAIIASCDNMISAYDDDAIAKGVPVVSGPAGSEDWYTKPGMFPLPTDISSIATSMVAVAKDMAHATKFANIYCTESAVCQQVNATLPPIAARLGVGFTSIAVSSTAPSYTAQCLQLQQQNVDYVMFNLTSLAASKIIRDCQAQGYNPTYGSTGQALGGADASYLKAQNLTLYAPDPAFPSAADAPPVTQFRTAMQKYAKDGNWQEGTASETWDGLQAVAKAMANVGPNPTAHDVLTGLYGLNGDDLGGELANKISGWTPGKPLGMGHAPCYFVTEIKDGKFVAPKNLTPVCPA